jgi:hypothetical protein
VSAMTWLQVFTVFAAGLSAAPGDRPSLEKPALSLRGEDWGLGHPELKLVALDDGWLGLVARNGKVQFRSSAGKWSAVQRLPMDAILISASAGAGILVTGAKLNENGPTRILLVGIDGHVKETWEVPDWVVSSLAYWKDTLWATVAEKWTSPSADGLLELLPGGRVERHRGIPETVEDGQTVVPWDAQLLFGPSWERVFCVPEECRHDGPCHYAYCYRRDTVTWLEYGKSCAHVVACGGYLLEPEGVSPDFHGLKHRQNQVVVRRIADGVKVASVGTAGVVACGGPDEFLVGDRSIAAFQLPSGRRLWSVPVGAGGVETMAQTGACTIALTTRDQMIRICRDDGRPVVTRTGKQVEQAKRPARATGVP